MQQSKTILLKVFQNAFSAQLAKGSLEAHDISCAIRNENFNQFNPIFNKSTGGVQLFVFEEDFEKAKEIIESEAFDLENVEETE